MADDESTSLNDRVIQEFRQNGGKVGPPFESSQVALFHLVGAKSGAPRITPLAYFNSDGALLIAAGAGGAPRNPAWVYNLRAMKSVTAELASGSVIHETRFTATELSGAERDRGWDEIVAIYPAVDAYAKATAGLRVIPVFRLDETP